MGRRKKPAETFKPTFSTWGQPCPYCRQTLVYEPAGPSWVCSEHGSMTRENLERGDKWIITSKTMGEALVIRRVEQFDEDPSVLNCGLPVFTEACLETMKAKETPEQKRWFWQARGRDLVGERQLRKADPTRTVFHPGKVVLATRLHPTADRRLTT